MSVTDTLKRPAVLGALLAVAVAGNLFQAGILAGRLGAHAMRPPKFERDFESRLRAVPEERRNEIREHLRRSAPAMREQHEALRALHAAIAAELAREQPDRALLEQKMAELRARTAAMQEALQKSFLDTALALPRAERQEMVEAMQQARGRGRAGRADDAGPPGGPGRHGMPPPEAMPPDAPMPPPPAPEAP